MGRERRVATTFAAIVFLAAFAVLLVRCGREVADGDATELAPPAAESAEVASAPRDEKSEPPAPASTARFTAHVLRFEGDELTLVESREIEGRVKAPRSVRPEGKLYFRVVDAAGETLWETALRDPRLVRYDSVNEDGELVGGQTKLSTVDFALRVPLLSGAVAIEAIDYTRPETPADLGRLPL